jgi:hypothetical protein
MASIFYIILYYLFASTDYIIIIFIFLYNILTYYIVKKNGNLPNETQYVYVWNN